MQRLKSKMSTDEAMKILNIEKKDTGKEIIEKVFTVLFLPPLFLTFCSD